MNFNENKSAEENDNRLQEQQKPVREGEPMGGHRFGENAVTPSGDDKNNPTEMAGYNNAYFARTEPSEEHPEDSNFRVPEQEGAPDYDKAQPYTTMTKEEPKPEPIERGNGENDRPHKSAPYTEGTNDNDGQEQTNIPGPMELPDQQKVGEPDTENEDEHGQEEK